MYAVNASEYGVDLHRGIYILGLDQAVVDVVSELTGSGHLNILVLRMYLSIFIKKI